MVFMVEGPEALGIPVSSSQLPNGLCNSLLRIGRMPRAWTREQSAKFQISLATNQLSILEKVTSSP